MRHAVVIILALLLAGSARGEGDQADVELDLAALPAELPQLDVVQDLAPAPLALGAGIEGGGGLEASVGRGTLEASVALPALPGPPLPLPTLASFPGGAKLRVSLPHAIDASDARAAAHPLPAPWAVPPEDPITAAMPTANAASRDVARDAERGAQDATLLPVSPLPPPPATAGLPTDLAIGATLLLLLLSSLYSRFERHTLLHSPARASIHAAILASPGLTVAEVGATMRLSRGALVHHVHMLEKHGLITSRNDGSHRRLYPPGAAAMQERPPTEKEHRILVILREEGPLTQAELARRLGVSRQAVHLQVKRLERSHRLVPVLANGGTRWRAQEGTEKSERPAGGPTERNEGARTAVRQPG